MNRNPAPVKGEYFPSSTSFRGTIVYPVTNMYARRIIHPAVSFPSRMIWPHYRACHVGANSKMDGIQAPSESPGHSLLVNSNLAEQDP